MAKKTSSITFRIDEEHDKVLRKIAGKQNISLNTLVNQIFSQYLEKDVFSEKFGMLKMSTDTFRRILAKVSEKNILDLATRAGFSGSKRIHLV